MEPMDQVPVLFADDAAIAGETVQDTQSASLRAVLPGEMVSGHRDIALQPFFRTHDVRYQMYWELTTKEAFEGRRESYSQMNEQVNDVLAE